MSDTRISVVMATYQGASFVQEQIDSLLAVLGPHDEIVVSDDCSQDGTRAILQAQTDPRVHLLPCGPRLGYQDNFARAISATQGEYIFFADQDDICLPARIPLSLEALERADCVCGDAIVVDHALRPLHESFFAQRHASFGFWSLLLRPTVIGATMACRRKFLMDNLPFPAGIPHDFWLSLQAARRGQLTALQTPFILYRRHSGAVSLTANARSRPLSRILAERLRLIRALIKRR